MKPWFHCSEHVACSFFFLNEWDLKISRANETKVRELSNTGMNVNRSQRIWKVQSGLIKSPSMWIQFPQASRHPVSDKEHRLSLSSYEWIPITSWVYVGLPVNHSQSLCFKDDDSGNILTKALSVPLIWNNRQLIEYWFIFLFFYMLVEWDSQFI